MPSKAQKFGEQSEALAANYLKLSGYRILERNYRNRIGEIDIIARDGKSLVFIEVKARKTGRYGSPKTAVTPAKQAKISNTATLYLKETGQLNCKARFDVVAIDARYNPPDIEVIKNAFERTNP